MIYCKADGCFISYLIDTQCMAFLLPMISHCSGIRLHAQKNASLNHRKKPGKRVTFPPLNQGFCQLHNTEASLSFPASCELGETILKERSPCATDLFSFSLPHPHASKTAWREFHCWCTFPHLSFPFLL